MAKNLYNLAAVTTVNDSDLLHVNQGSVSSDKKVTKANLLKEVNSSITSLNSSLANSCKVVYVSDKVGAQSAGAHGYVGVSYTVPSGFKTSGIYSLSVGHPGQASSAGFSVIGSVARGVTGTNTAYVSYTVPYANLPDSASDFGLYIHCVPSTWDV